LSYGYNFEHFTILEHINIGVSKDRKLKFGGPEDINWILLINRYLIAEIKSET